MDEVVQQSMHYMTDADVHAIAVYLKEGPARAGSNGSVVVASEPRLSAGQHLYAQICALCHHQENGGGAPGAIPNLANNIAVTQQQPNNVINAMLTGLPGGGDYGTMPSFAGALSDQDVADIANYVRSSWGNKASANATPDLVAELRDTPEVGAAGTEAARAFGCPKVGADPVPNVLASPAQANMLAGAQASDLGNRISSMIYQIRQQQPDVSDADLTNTMNAAFCPAVANTPSMTTDDRRALLMQLSSRVQETLEQHAMPTGTHVMANVPLTPEVYQQLAQEAASHHQPPARYIADLLAKQGKPAQ
jgi:mono/diheme cytochrome c family protein